MQEVDTTTVCIIRAVCVGRKEGWGKKERGERRTAQQESLISAITH